MQGIWKVENNLSFPNLSDSYANEFLDRRNWILFKWKKKVQEKSWRQTIKANFIAIG